MDTTVYSMLGPVGRQPAPASARLRPALACAERQDWRAAQDLLTQALAHPSDRRRAHFLLWEVRQACGQPGLARAHLDAVLREGRLTSRPGPAAGRRVLAIATPGDFQANLPLGALLDAGGTELHTLWLTAGTAPDETPYGAGSGRLPAIDAIFVVIAEDESHRAALAAADRLADALGAPVINRGARIAALSRPAAAALLHDLPDAVVPWPARLSRAPLRATPPPSGAPFIIRPAGSHAGRDLARIERGAELP
jgi:hypothetical protein